MYTADVQRSELVHLGSSRPWKPKPSKSIGGAPGVQRCCLVWLSDQPEALPDVIVVPDGDTQDFFAWSNAYLSHLVPLSAIFTVIEHAQFREAADPRAPGPAIDERKLRGLVGLVHAEVIAACHGSFAPTQAGLTPFTSTLSWVLLQAAARLLVPEVSELAERWSECRRLLGARALSYQANDIIDTWCVILGTVTRHDSEVAVPGADAINEFIWSDLSTSAVVRLGVGSQVADQLEALRHGPLEQRVVRFSDMVRQFSRNVNYTIEHAVLEGFGLSLISQGSFSHIELAAGYGSRDIRALMWYAWFEFSRDEHAPASHVTSNVSQRLLQLCARAGAKPRPDISLDELRVLSRMPKPLADVPIDLRHPIDVEVVRGAVCKVRAEDFGRRETKPGSRRAAGKAGRPEEQRELFKDEES